jgi:folate-binding protein YgfZ
MTLVALTDHASLRVHGPDARTFLQSQLSCDVDAVGPDRAQLSAWHDPKGRVLAVMTVLAVGDGYLLVLPAELAGTVARRLKMFILRSKVTVDAGPAVAGLLDALPPFGQARATEPWSVVAGPEGVATRLPGLPRWLVAGRLADSAPADDQGLRAWECAAVEAGLPEVYAATSGLFVAQMLNLDDLGAVSFTKGCFPGQEIIARAHYLGRVKRRMRSFVVAGGAPAAGDTLADTGPGTVVRSAQGDDASRVLAVVAADAQGPFALSDGRSLEPA